jgi:hypothetical protein
MYTKVNMDLLRLWKIPDSVRKIELKQRILLRYRRTFGGNRKISGKIQGRLL